jgi:hypothetical protein
MTDGGGAAPDEATAAQPATGALEKVEAIRLACEWYDSDQGPFAGRYSIATPVLNAYFNSCIGDVCEWSLRYFVAPSTGEEVNLQSFEPCAPLFCARGAPVQC